MNERKELILDIIIREHIKTGAPVGSSLIVDKYKIKASPATVRNDMAELENNGYILQPHTSAGRIPTEKAYTKYLSKINGSKIKREAARELDSALSSRDEAGFKQAAKVLAKRSGNAVFWAFHQHNLYYTGLSNLLMQPEFVHTDLLYNFSEIIDRLDDIIESIFHKIEPRPQVMIGTNSPFGDFCGTIMTKYQHKDNIGLLGIIGPMRMDYENNLALVNYINEKISKK